MRKDLNKLDQRFYKNLNRYINDPNQINKLLLKRTRIIDKKIIEKFLNLGLSRRYALIATGGYGRNEIFPSSDIDISIIDLKPSTKINSENLEVFISWLWNQNFKISHSVRSLKEVKAICLEDLAEFTSYLSHRLLSSPEGYKRKIKMAIKKIIDSVSINKFLKHKSQEQLLRHKSFNATEFNLEPDIKESPGCLRDMHASMWIIHKCLGMKSISNFDLEIISDHDLKEAITAYSHMKVLRFILNDIAHQNRLSFELQVEIAKKYGFKKTRKLSSVELFMKGFFQNASIISDFNELIFQITNEKRLQGITFKAKKKKIFYVKDYLDILKIFKRLGANKKKFQLSVAISQSIKASLRKIPKHIFLETESQKLFLDILKSKYNLSSILKKMKQLGLLKRLIPEFGEIEGQMQFDMFHIYSVDEHTFKVVRNMRQMYIRKIDSSLSMESELIRKLPKIELLYLAGIFHDLGKGKGGNHSIVGKKIVKEFSSRAGLSMYDSDLIEWLVENHLLMSSLSQKKDVHDQSTIDEFISNANNIDKLNYLYLLTINDIRGTNPSLWNTWKHDLLKHLYLQSRRILNKEESADTKRNIDDRKKRAYQVLSNNARKKSNMLWDQLPENYFQKNTTKKIIRHTELFRLMLKDGVAIKVDKEGDYLRLDLLTMNRPGLFYQVCELFHLLMLETIDADILTSKDNNYAINSYLIKHQKLGNNLYSSDLNKIASKLHDGINRGIKLSPIKMKSGKTPFSYKTKFSIQKHASGEKNLVTVETLDQPRLLTKIAKHFFELNIDVHSARITTLGEKVEDNFLILDRRTGGLISKNKENKLMKSIKAL